MRSFSDKDVVSILKKIESQSKSIQYEIWALNYHMHVQRSECLMMTPNERSYWIDELIEQRKKENEEIKKNSR